MNMSTVSSVETAQFKGFAPGFDGANAEALADELGARFVAAREAISISFSVRRPWWTKSRSRFSREAMVF
jgi:hypothetical protein